MDGRTLDEVRSGMSDPATLGRRRPNRLEQYNSWTKYITYKMKPDNYADTFFVFGLLALYNVSVRIVSDSYDEPHVYYLGAMESSDVITAYSFHPRTVVVHLHLNSYSCGPRCSSRRLDTQTP